MIRATISNQLSSFHFSRKIPYVRPETNEALRVALKRRFGLGVGLMMIGAEVLDDVFWFCSQQVSR